jgi:tetratricopeptide (TPR) repeat protein
LCGAGHAFLAAYYLEKGLLERSQAFLDEALRLAPHDPWVKLVEALVYERAYDNDDKAILILEDLSRKSPSIPLARYLLGEAYIRGAKYRAAAAAFAARKGDKKGRIAFWRIRRALAVLERTADRGAGKAEALLALSRSFSTLKDYPMAKDLYLRVLEETPDGLPKADRIAAYCELARIYEQQGDNNSAYQAYRHAFNLNPESPAAREGIGAVLPSSLEQVAKSRR